jgi:hypothetical protein
MYLERNEMGPDSVPSGSKLPKIRRIILTAIFVAAPVVASACGSSTGPGGGNKVTTTTQIPGY